MVPSGTICRFYRPRLIKFRYLCVMRTEIITSAQNPKIKTLLELQEKSKARRKEGLFVVEGRRELLHCLSAGYAPYAVFICKDILTESELDEIAAKCSCRFYELPQHLYDKVAYRGLFLIDREGVVRHMLVNDMPLGRSIDEAIRMVDALQHFEQFGEVCPMGWHKGETAMQATHEGVAGYLADK